MQQKATSRSRLTAGPFKQTFFLSLRKITPVFKSKTSLLLLALFAFFAAVFTFIITAQHVATTDRFNAFIRITFGILLLIYAASRFLKWKSHP